MITSEALCLGMVFKRLSLYEIFEILFYGYILPIARSNWALATLKSAREL
jgi:hypothetical protein